MTPNPEPQSQEQLREEIKDLMVCHSHGYMCEDCPLENNVDKVVKLIQNQADKKMLEIIGSDEYPKNHEQNLNHLRTPERKARDKLRQELRAKVKQGGN